MIVRGSTGVNDGQWHHVTATYDGSLSASGVKLYVDGVLDTMVVIDNNLGTNSLRTSDLFTIGQGQAMARSRSTATLTSSKSSTAR